MRQLPAHNMPACLLSTAGTWGEIQIVPRDGTIVLDLQARNYDASGHLHRDYALARLSLATATRLRDLLSEALVVAAVADSRQPGLWSDATLQATTTRRRAGA
jgi:hypothetical protein